MPAKCAAPRATAHLSQEYRTPAWEQRKLGELYQKNDERNTDGLGSERTLSVASMTFNSAGNGADDSSLPNYKRLRLGDIAFEGHTNKEFAYGRFVLNDAGNGIMSPRFTCLRPIVEQEYSFWKYFIHSEKVMRPILVNSTKSGTMMNELVVEDFLKQEILVPSLPEQRRIGAFFDRLDSLITLHQRKYDKLCVLKKSMLDKMFPKGGSLYPEIRFAGFTDPWEQRKLGQHLKLSRELGHTGVDARKLTVKLWGKGVVEKTDLYGGSAQTQYYIRHAGQFMYGKLDFLHAAFGVVPDKLDCFESTLDSPAFDIEGLDSSFLLNLVTQEDFYLKNGNIANGSRKAKRIHEETFLNMEIRAPELVEQRRIGAFLDRLDSLITLHQRKYDGCANPLFLERRISCRKPSHQNRCSATTTPSG